MTECVAQVLNELEAKRVILATVADKETSA